MPKSFINWEAQLKPILYLLKYGDPWEDTQTTGWSTVKIWTRYTAIMLVFAAVF